MEAGTKSKNYMSDCRSFTLPASRLSTSPVEPMDGRTDGFGELVTVVP